MSADAPLAQADEMTAEQEAHIIHALFSLGQTPVFGLEDVAMLGNKVSVPAAGTPDEQPMLHGTGSSGAVGPSVVPDSGSLIAGNAVPEKQLGESSAAGMKQATSELFVFGAPTIEAPNFDFVPADGPVYPRETFSMFLAKLNADQLREVESILRQEKEAGWPSHYGNAGRLLDDRSTQIAVPGVTPAIWAIGLLHQSFRTRIGSLVSIDVYSVFERCPGGGKTV